MLVGCSGDNRTELKPLPYTINDVKGFAESLIATGVLPASVKLMHDERTGDCGRYLPGKDKILKELVLLLRGIEPEDTLIVALSPYNR